MPGFACGRMPVCQYIRPPTWSAFLLIVPSSALVLIIIIIIIIIISLFVNEHLQCNGHRNLSCLYRRLVAPSSTAQRPTMAGVNVTCQRSQREAGGAGARTPDLRITLDLGERARWVRRANHCAIPPPGKLQCLFVCFVCLYVVYRLFYNKLVFSQRRHNHSYSCMNPIVSLANLNEPPLQEHKLGKAWPDRGCLPLNGIQVKK